jgi:Cu2+-exporting ATPase
LERFYELKGNKAVPPIGSKVFQASDIAPLLAEIQTAESATEQAIVTTRLSIEGISCIGCVWLIEAIYKRQAGANKIVIDARSNAIELTWRRGDFSIQTFAEELQKIGYRLVPYNEDSSGNRQGSKQLAYRIGLCGFFLLNTMLFTLPGYLGMGGEFFLAPLFQMLGGLFATLSLIVGGGYFISRAWQAAKTRVLHIDLPIAAGLIAAYLGSLIGCLTQYTSLIYFDFVATFVFLMLAGRWLQEFALERNRAQLQRQKVGPREVTVLEGPQAGERLPVHKVSAGLSYSIAPGEINPVAAQPLDSQGTLSLEWINGEAEPVIWPQAKTAPAGAINVGLHALRYRANESWPDSLLAQLLERSEDTFRDQRLQNILRSYIACVLLIAVIGGAAWLATTGNVLKSTQVFISILIVSCPCALGVALPMCDEFATARLRRAGLFIKTAEIWERLRQVNTVVFDKTGTLTMDIPRLTNTGSIQKLDADQAQALYQLVNQNVHPIARSLREALLAYHPTLKSLPKTPSNGVEEVIGKGLLWNDSDGHQWSLGAGDWLAKDKQSPTGARSVLRKDGDLVAAFNFIEDVRDDAKESLDALHQQNLTTAILSGDAVARVAMIAKQLGLASETAKGQCSPTDKANWIETHAPASALMIGDGANDSLAFDKAICRGTPVVDRSILEASADFFFFGRSLRCLPMLFSTTQRRRLTVSTVFAVAVIYNISAVSICLAGMMHPLLAAILMPLSSIVTLSIAWIGLGRR